MKYLKLKILLPLTMLAPTLTSACGHCDKNLNTIETNHYNSSNQNLIDYNNKDNYQFNVRMFNQVSDKSFVYNNNIVTYSNDLNLAKNKLLFSSLHNLDTNQQNYSTAYKELSEGKLVFEKDTYNIVPVSVEREYQYKKICSAGFHTELLPSCGKSHLHTRGCMKSYRRECRGCISTTGIFTNTIEFNKFEFDSFFKFNNIDHNVFDFAKLIKVDYKNSYKFYNRNILSFTFNDDYFKSKTLMSFNSYLVDLFKQQYQQKVNSNLFNLLVDKIQQGYITDYFHFLPEFLGINIKNYGTKHNLKYWLDSIEYKDTNQIMNELNQLNKFDFIDYLKVNNDKSNNKLLWNQLYRIFSNSSIVKNISFNISYNTKLNNSNPVKTISLDDLMNNKNNNITYLFSNLNIEHNFEDQAIYVTDVSLSSNTKDAYLNYQSLGLIINSQQNNADYKSIPLKNNAETWFKFNQELDVSNIFEIKKYDINQSVDYLNKNNLSPIPSENKSNSNLIGILTNLHNSPYISLNDKDWLKNLTEFNNNLSSTYFNYYVKKVELKYYDTLGTIRINIILKNNDVLGLDIKGFNSKQVQLNLINNNIAVNKQEFENINKETILDNFVSFNTNNNVNKAVYVNTTKEDFIDNILNEVNINKIDDYYKVNIKYKNHLNVISEINFSISKNINNDSSNNDNNENDNDNNVIVPPDNQEENDNNKIDSKNNLNYLYLLLIPLVILLITITLILIKRKKINVKKQTEKN